jgi:predicted GIY-YIG superfamily endonuclease
MESWFVYICKSKAGHYYTGISNCPQKRIVVHNSGNGAKMALDQGGFELLYISHPFNNKSLPEEEKSKSKDGLGPRKKNSFKKIGYNDTVTPQ